jgi:cysteine desulfurase family protein (TIGR01976 family)
MDNAGGSQVPASVANAVREFMLSSYVQVGADYPASKRSTQTVADAHSMINTVMGGERSGRTIFGSSSTSLCRMLSDCYSETLQPGDEIIVGESGHEANVGPWTRLANRGLTVKIWEANPETGECELASLKKLLTDRTKVVAFVQVSNILGHTEDFKACIQAAHAVGARAVLDGVAYTPHAIPDVEAWDVDWYVFSCYKVFGPHIGALFGKHEAIAELNGPNHYFLPRDYLPGKFELGGSNMESCAGLLGLKPYLSFLAGSSDFDRATAVNAWKAMEDLERPLTARFLEFLRSKPKVRIVGRGVPDAERVPTISFMHELRTSKEIADEALNRGIGIRWGNFYSVRLLERMGIDPAAGVARASFAHYNSIEEVDQLIAALDPIL